MAEVEEIETASWNRGENPVKQLGTTNYSLGQPFYVHRRRFGPRRS
jgi:hypothetical protein